MTNGYTVIIPSVCSVLVFKHFTNLLCIFEPVIMQEIPIIFYNYRIPHFLFCFTGNSPKTNTNFVLLIIIRQHQCILYTDMNVRQLPSLLIYLPLHNDCPTGQTKSLRFLVIGHSCCCCCCCFFFFFGGGPFVFVNQWNTWYAVIWNQTLERPM